MKEYSIMNEEIGKSPKLKKWLRWMEVIRKDVGMLLRDTNMFWEVQDIIRANPRIQKRSAFYRYLGRTYLSHALAGLRRQIKPNKDSISLVGLLEELAETPEELSFKYYCSILSGTTTNQMEAIIKGDFKKYADASGRHVCPQMVMADRDKLKSAVEACEGFADKRIAHRDKDNPDTVPTFGELDECIKLLDKVYVKYHLLFYAEGMSTLMPAYQYDWKKVFLEPWIKTGLGSAKGLIHMAEDFDDELPEFREYMQ